MYIVYKYELDSERNEFDNVIYRSFHEIISSGYEVFKLRTFQELVNNMPKQTYLSPRYGRHINFVSFQIYESVYEYWRRNMDVTTISIEDIKNGRYVMNSVLKIDMHPVFPQMLKPISEPDFTVGDISELL